MDTAVEARQILRRQSLGVLSTHSVEIAGYPFGSVTPYAVGADGEPVLLMSRLAQHTKNIAADGRVSLTVLERDLDDPHSASRLTLVGDVLAIEDGLDAARGVYLNHLPTAATFIDFPDFSLFKISLRRVRFIAGFGRIEWISRDGFVLENPLASVEQGVLAHMNADHQDALTAYCRAFLGIAGEDARMCGIDSEGFDLLVGTVLHRIPFEEPVVTAADARTRLVALARRAREAIGQ